VPKGTFDKIAPAKKERLLREASLLFAERGFAQTDVGELATRAGVAKGSLYNYFINKDDLYLHICRDALERSRHAVYSGLDSRWNVERQLEHIFTKGVAFAKRHPEYVALYLNVSSAGMSRFADEISLEVEKPTADRLKTLLTVGASNGEVRDDLDIEATAFTINGLYIMTLATVASTHYRIRFREYFGLKQGTKKNDIDAQVRRVLSLINTMLRPVGRC
jgi:AcrR family transcriptional regulator